MTTSLSLFDPRGRQKRKLGHHDVVSMSLKNVSIYKVIYYGFNFEFKITKIQTPRKIKRYVNGTPKSRRMASCAETVTRRWNRRCGFGGVRGGRCFVQHRESCSFQYGHESVGWMYGDVWNWKILRKLAVHWQVWVIPNDGSLKRGDLTIQREVPIRSNDPELFFVDRYAKWDYEAKGSKRTDGGASASKQRLNEIIRDI
jgi:hypothetical protein